MLTAATIRFIDRESSDEAVVIVRHDDVAVGLAISLTSDGDIEVFIGKDAARSLIDALKMAVE